jgi:hypothetical protein
VFSGRFGMGPAWVRGGGGGGMSIDCHQIVKQGVDSRKFTKKRGQSSQTGDM